jgi:hypothetical protein
VEAECCAYLVADALGLGGADESRGYVQGWLARGGSLDDTTARSVYKGADAILAAGRAPAAAARPLAA